MVISASVTPGGAAKSISATHIGIASGASMPDSFAMLSHLVACVPRRSITRSKSNIFTRLLSSFVVLPDEADMAITVKDGSCIL
jgi:hypothetical protein